MELLWGAPKASSIRKEKGEQVTLLVQGRLPPSLPRAHNLQMQQHLVLHWAWTKFLALSAASMGTHI